MSAMNGYVTANGTLDLSVIRAQKKSLELPTYPDHQLSLREMLYWATPREGLPDHVNAWKMRNLKNFWRGYWRVIRNRAVKAPDMYGQLWMTVIRADGDVEELGLVSLRCVTTAGVKKIVSLLNGVDASTATTFKYHALGTGSGAEAAGDTALTTEVETRGTGTQTTDTGSPSTVYRTVGTVTATTTRAVTEHGVFSQLASGGTLLDRTYLSTNVINLLTGDSISATYDLTLPAGS